MESMYKEEHDIMVKQLYKTRSMKDFKSLENKMERLRAKLEHKGTKLERLRGKLERSQNAELLLRWNNNDIKALYIALSKENEYLRDEITEANIELAENAQSDYSQANYGRKARKPGFMRKEEEAAGIFQHEIPIGDEEGDHSDTSTWGPCPKKRRRGDVLPEPADEHIPQMPVGHTHKEMDKLFADLDIPIGEFSIITDGAGQERLLLPQTGANTHEEMDMLKYIKLHADMLKKLAHIKQQYTTALGKSGYATQ